MGLDTKFLAENAAPLAYRFAPVTPRKPRRVSKVGPSLSNERARKFALGKSACVPKSIDSGTASNRGLRGAKQRVFSAGGTEEG